MLEKNDVGTVLTLQKDDFVLALQSVSKMKIKQSVFRITNLSTTDRGVVAVKLIPANRMKSMFLEDSRSCSLSLGEIVDKLPQPKEIKKMKDGRKTTYMFPTGINVDP